MPKYVPPTITAKSFSCPHCGAHADQTWYETYANTIQNDSCTPQLMTKEHLELWKQSTRNSPDPEQRQRFQSMLPAGERLV